MNQPGKAAYPADFPLLDGSRGFPLKQTNETRPKNTISHADSFGSVSRKTWRYENTLLPIDFSGTAQRGSSTSWRSFSACSFLNPATRRLASATIWYDSGRRELRKSV